MPEQGVVRGAPSFIGRFSIGLLLLFAGVVASPSWAVNEHSEKAVSGYLNTTLSTIATLKPYIDKSVSERATALAAMGIKDDVCGAAKIESIYAHEHLAEGAGYLCEALIAWMQDEDIFTCSRVDFSGKEFARDDPADAVIAKRHKADNILSTRLRLQKAANCTGKTVTYWGIKTLSLYDQLSRSVAKSGDLVAPSTASAAPTIKEIENSIFLCHLSTGRDETNKSGVVDAADCGCYAIYYLSTKKVSEACGSLDTGLKKIGSMGSKDPLARDASALKTKLDDKFRDLNCGPVIAAAQLAEAEAAKARQLAAAKAPAPARSEPVVDPNEKANEIIRNINTLTGSYVSSSDSAQRLIERGEDLQACGYYQEAMTTLRYLENAYSKLGRETGDDQYDAEARRLVTVRTTILENERDMCGEAGKRNFN